MSLRASVLVLVATAVCACSTPARVAPDAGPGEPGTQGIGSTGSSDAATKPPEMVAACPGQTTRCASGCVDVSTDAANCGACETACGDAEICNGVGRCSEGCQRGFVACGGACINPMTNLMHCGASDDCKEANSGTACPDGEVCTGGTCAKVCGLGVIACDGQCISPQTDRQHCGAVGDCIGDNGGVACATGEVCSDRRCVPTCGAPLIDCGGSCINPAIARQFCGASADCTGDNTGVQCSDGEVCTGGACETTCSDGEVQCGDICADPLVDNAYCGALEGCGDVAGSEGAMCATNEECAEGVCYSPPCGAGHPCDPTNLDGATCSSLGLGTGMLFCDPATCTHDSSMCGSGTGGMGGGGG